MVSHDHFFEVSPAGFRRFPAGPVGGGRAARPEAARGQAAACGGGAGAAMAERTEQRLEDRVPELEQLERVGLFTRREVR